MNWTAWLGGCGREPADDAALTRHRNLGKGHFENGDTDLAIAHFDTCLALSGGAGIDRLNRAKALISPQ